MASAIDETVIPTGRVRPVLITLGTTAVAILGLYFYVLDPIWPASPRSSEGPSLVQILGLITFAGLTVGAMFSMNQLLTRGPGLSLSSAGFLDQTTPTATGLIPWSEITGFHVVKIRGHRLLAVEVTNPEKYVLRGSPLRQITNRVNLTKYGSPIVISAHALGLEIDELEEVCQHYLEQYRRKRHGIGDGRFELSPNSAEHRSARAASSIIGKVNAKEATKKPT